ncbi:MAG: hypothetical protein JXR48_18355 [Candidatus Delongbacteria bacterium]|nr:hypothetical protein [Candidatus Delongbacteria bacterium]MBN2836923.1 hypothetical protein [Candidatus Delongbacteria bacterium]
MKYLILVLTILVTIYAERIDSKMINFDFDSKLYNLNGALFTGTSVIRDSQGNIVREIEIKNGMMDGDETTYQDGKVISKLHFEKNEKSGRSYIYSLTTFKLCEISDYKNSVRNGLYQTFDQYDEYLESESHYVDGKREGEHKTYYPSGKIKSTGFYVKGIKSGKWIFYKEDGTIEREKKY